jgi:hypothetical protein
VRRARPFRVSITIPGARSVTTGKPSRPLRGCTSASESAAGVSPEAGSIGLIFTPPFAGSSEYTGSSFTSRRTTI